MNQSAFHHIYLTRTCEGTLFAEDMFCKDPFSPAITQRRIRFFKKMYPRITTRTIAFIGRGLFNPN